MKTRTTLLGLGCFLGLLVTFVLAETRSMWWYVPAYAFAITGILALFRDTSKRRDDPVDFD